MNELYAAMMSWAVSLSGYAPPAEMPDVVMVSHAVLVDKACAGRECKVVGWFPPGHTIFVDARLSPNEDLFASSIIVHEMVHYLQQESHKYGTPYTCESLVAMEREAYAVQREYFVRYGVYRPISTAMHNVGCELAAHAEDPKAERAEPMALEK